MPMKLTVGSKWSDQMEKGSLRVHHTFYVRLSDGHQYSVIEQNCIRQTKWNNYLNKKKIFAGANKDEIEFCK